ncbi:reverse transcriptase domain-containing protein [Tanacetum coccineum]
MKRWRSYAFSLVKETWRYSMAWMEGIHIWVYLVHAAGVLRRRAVQGVVCGYRGCIITGHLEVAIFIALSLVLIRKVLIFESSLVFGLVDTSCFGSQGTASCGTPPPNNNGPPPVVRPNAPAPRSMEELCQPSINGQGGPIASIPIEATDFGLRHHMIQQVQNTCQFHGLPGDDANRHIDKFLEITQHMKQNGVSDDALRLSLFLYSLTHHAIAWYDRLPKNSIHSFDDMMRKFLLKYFPPSMLDECLALADLGASINLMPLSVWKKLSLPELISTHMTLELANRSTVIPEGVAEDVFVKVGKFYFPADLVVVDYDVDPRVPLILERPFLRTTRALMMKPLHVACEEYAQDVLRFLDSSTSGKSQPQDPIISSSSPSFTPFEVGDFILEEIEACLSSDSIPPGIDDAEFDSEEDIRLLENLLSDDPSSLLPPKDINFKELKTIKSSINDPSELELKDLPSHLEYAFLEGTDRITTS